MPRNVVVVLLDSLNRHLIGPYGSTEFATPNLDRIAARSVRFDRHVTGSLPCMPARHDLLTGSLDFLWRPWGSIELWEEPVTFELRRQGVTTMLVSDHPHLFETGGENYHCDFTAWDYVRGHEGDPWRTCPDPTFVGAPGATRLACATRTTTRARGSATSPTTRGRAPWRPPPTGWSARRRRPRATCWWSTSSIRTSRSTRPSGGRRCTTRTTRHARSGRRTPWTRRRAASSPRPIWPGCAPRTAPSCR